MDYSSTIISSNIESLNALFSFIISLLFLVVFAVILILFVINVAKRYKVTNTDSVTSYDIISGSLIKKNYNNLDLMSFDDIKGLSEVKQKVKDFVGVFNDREKYIRNGVKIPRGILFYGPPGCGKTSLAKAIAKEAGVNFLCRNASDLLDNQFKTSNLIAALFSYARKHSPCIIFIDELDILGSRYTMMGAGHNQVEVTRLLAEMDGMQNNDDILVIGATNDKDKLDNALLRSGRFSKKFYIPLPSDISEINELIDMYKGNLEFEDEHTRNLVVKSFSGLSPADIKEILNEVGITCVNENRKINIRDVDDARMELISETVLINRAKFNKESMRCIAWHELGHAIVGFVRGLYVSEVSIRGTNTGMEGYTALSDKHDDLFNLETRETIFKGDNVFGVKSEIISNYGGLAAELVFFDFDNNKVTFGSMHDITLNTKMALSLINYNYDKDYNYIKYDKSELLKNRKNLDLNTKEDLENLLQPCYKEAINIVKDNKEVLEKLVGLLLNKETISHDEFNAFVKKHMNEKYLKLSKENARKNINIKGVLTEKAKEEYEKPEKALKNLIKSIDDSRNNKIDNSMKIPSFLKKELEKYKESISEDI